MGEQIAFEGFSAIRLMIMKNFISLNTNGLKIKFCRHRLQNSIISTSLLLIREIRGKLRPGTLH